MQMGGAFAEALASILSMRNASLSKSENSSFPARIQGNIGFPAAAKQMRRLFRPRGRAARQDVLVATDIEVSSEAETDSEAWVAHCKAKKTGGEKGMNHGGARKSKYNVKGGGQTLNGFNRLTEIRPRPPQMRQREHKERVCAILHAYEKSASPSRPFNISGLAS